MKKSFVIHFDKDTSKGLSAESCDRHAGNTTKLRQELKLQLKIITKVIHEIKPAMKRHVYP
jgi:hypothetical protein